MRLISHVLILALFAIIPFSSFGATYYLSTTGSDAFNGTSSTTPWASFSKIPALSPGDTILLKRGDVFTAQTLSFHNKSGSATSTVTVSAYGTGANPKIHTATSSYPLSISGSSSNLSFSNIDLYSGSTSTPWGIYMFNSGSNISFDGMTISSSSIFIHSSAVLNNITFSNITKNGSSSHGLSVTGTVSNLAFSSSTISGALVGISLAGNSTTTNATFNNVTISGASTTAFNIARIQDVTISNSSLLQNMYGIKVGPGSPSYAKNLTIINTRIASSTSDGIIFQQFGDNVSIQNSRIEGNGGYGIYFASQVTNFSIQNSTSTNNSGSGMNITNISTGSISNSAFDGNFSSGIGISGSSTVTLLHVSASRNQEDGFDGGGNAYIICDACVAVDNGTDGQGGNGDGFSWHNTAAGIIRNSYAANNKKSSFAHVDDSSLNMYNNIFYHDTLGTLQIMYLSGSSTVSNSVFVNPSQQGGAMRFASAVPNIVKNNIIYGFNVGINGASSTVSDFNNIYNTSGSAYSCWVTGDCPLTTNATSTDPLFVNLGSRDFRLSDYSPMIDSGTVIGGRTSDYLGNPIYGTPDLGPYEYQPPFTVNASSTVLNTSGAIRIYKNGKFRYTSATSSENSISLAAMPVDGYGTGTYGEYLNISHITSTPTLKQWTASSSVATSTVFSLRDLIPNTVYTISIDGVTSTTTSSGADGTLSFVYSGGWSTHVFAVSIPQPDAPVVTVPARVTTVTGYGSSSYTPPMQEQAPIAPPVSVAFARNLQSGMSHPEVKSLQQFLNSKGFIVAKAGAGSVGKETNYFGPATRAALAKFQKAHTISPAVGYFGPVTRKYIQSLKP